MLELVHYIHITSAAVFVGSVVFFDWGIGIGMLRMDPADRKHFSMAVGKPAGMVIMTSLILAVVAGVTRLFMSGMIQNVGDLFHGYGLRATIALSTIILAEAISGPLRKKMRQGLINEDDALFVKSYLSQAVVSVAMLLIVLFMMLSMRMGVY